MPSSLNVQPAKRADAASLAAHAYRFGSAEDHVDRDRTHLNQVLHGPATFEATRAGIDALPDKQPNGRKIRTDANYTAQLICTFPEELDESQLDEWARETVAWAKDQAPGQLMYAVMHLDEGRPHIHMGIAAVEESGKLNYRALFGRESLNDPGENLLAMQKTYAARIAHLAVEPTQGKEYEDTGMNAWRILKAREEGRQEKAAELQRETEKLNQEKSKNLALSGSLETARQAALTADRAREAQKKRAETAESERNQQKERAGKWENAYNGLAKKYNELATSARKLLEDFKKLADETGRYSALLKVLRTKFGLTDDDPRAEQLAEQIVDDGMRALNQRERERAAKTAQERDLGGQGLTR